MNLTSDFSLTSSFGGLLFPRSLRTSPIDELLNKPDIHLEELLEDEDFSFELKNGNPKLLDYLTKSRENIRKLIDYITKLAPDESDQNRAYKFPFRACEIFESDIASIMNSFFGTARPSLEAVVDSPEKAPEDKSIEAPKEQTVETKEEKDQNGLLDYAFAFLESPDVKNCVLNGYFSKLVQLLFKRNPSALLEYIYSNSNYLLLLAQNFQERAICELVLLFLCYEHTQFVNKKFQTAQIKSEVLNIIIDRMNKERDDPDVLTNAALLINDILCKYQTIADGKEIIQHFHSKDFIDIVLSYIQPEQNLNISNACNILYAILCTYTPQGHIPGIVENEDPTYDEALLSQDPVFKGYLQSLEIFSDMLKKVPEAQEIKTSYGATIKPFGTGRLRALEIIERMIKMKSDTLYQKISDLELISTITNIFVNSMWNNMLHYTYEKLVNTILENGHQTLLKELFEKANLVEVLLGIFQEEEVEIPGSKRTTRKGYLGHAIRICNELSRHSNINDTIQEYVKKNSQWETFVSTHLKKRNELNNTEIGGYNPRNFYNMGMEGAFGLIPGEGVVHYSARDQEQGFTSSASTQERSFGSTAQPLEIVTSDSPERERGSVGPDTTDYDYELQNNPVKVTSPKRPNIDLFTVTKEELKHNAVMVAEKVVQDSPDPMRDDDNNPSSPEMAKPNDPPKDPIPEIQPYTLSTLVKKVELSPKVEQFENMLNTPEPKAQTSPEPAENHIGSPVKFNLSPKEITDQTQENNTQQPSSRDSDVIPSRESEDILQQVAEEGVAIVHKDEVNRAISPSKKYAEEEQKGAYGDASPEEIKMFEDFKKQSPMSDFEAWKREMKERQNSVIKPFTLSQGRHQTDKGLNFLEASKVPDPFASLTTNLNTINTNTGVIKKQEPKPSDPSLPTSAQSLETVKSELSYLQVNKTELPKPSSLNNIEESKTLENGAILSNPEPKLEPKVEAQAETKPDFKATEIKQIEVKPATFSFYNVQPEENQTPEITIKPTEVPTTTLADPIIKTEVQATTLTKPDENKENTLPSTGSITSSRGSDSIVNPSTSSPGKMITRRVVQSMNPATSDLNNTSFSSISSNSGKVKLILRVKKRENENHKQIINLITKLSKGEKVDLQSTSIEIIDPSNPDLGYLSSRSAPLSSERGKMVNENQKIQLKPVEESPVVTSDGK